MKSKANIKGHALHPILIGFPVAFFTGAFLFDLLAYTNNNNLWITARYLDIAGIIGGLIAAVPGFIDYLFTVPPNSSAKKRATIHALINVAMLATFGFALFIRQQANNNLGMVVIIELTGIILLGITGWMGGTLVTRNQISIDIRYANAGKWKEAYIKPTGGLVEAAKADELKTDQMKLLHVNNARIVLGRTDKGYVAFDDRCTHKGGSLAGGAMICGTVQCPWHGSQFDVNTGACKAGPAKEGIKTYGVTEKDGGVYLMID
jgi:nitrite reductase/ring-hydroxylating ferredoxin subunit/uncharacterized membrane protein